MKVELISLQEQEQQQELFTAKLKDVLSKEGDLKYDIALLCHEIQEKKEWKKVLGYKTLEEYVKTELEPFYDITPSYFYIYSQIGKVIKKFKVDRSLYKEIGFSKFRIVAPLLDNVSDEIFKDSWIDKLKNIKYVDLYKEIYQNKKQTLQDEKNAVITDEEKSIFLEEEKEKEEKIFEEREKEVTLPLSSRYSDVLNVVPIEAEASEENKVKYINFSLDQDIYNEVVKTAFDIVENLTGFVSIDKKFLYICLDFIAMHTTEKDKIDILKTKII